MGPFFEHVAKTSILLKDFDDVSKLLNEEKEYLSCNRHVIDLLPEYMDKELLDSIQEENLLQKTHHDAHRLCKFLEKIYEEDSDDKDQEEEEEESVRPGATGYLMWHVSVPDMG